MRRSIPIAVLGALAALATPALGQRVPFARSIDTLAPPILDVETEGGRIEVVAGEPGRVAIEGAVTVRVGLDVPADAASLAKAVAEHPPIAQEGITIRLRPPSDDAARRAVTVSYRVTVPKGARVVSRSASGATSIDGLGGEVSVTTGSAAIDLRDLGSDVKAASGSGAITMDGVRGSVDVETRSSAVNLRGLRGGLTARSGSGRIFAAGVPASAWRVSTSSSAIEVRLDPNASAALRASSGSGSVRLEGDGFTGTRTKALVVGAVGGGGPDVHLESRSGSIHVTLAGAAAAPRAAARQPTLSRRAALSADPGGRRATPAPGWRGARPMPASPPPRRASADPRR